MKKWRFFTLFQFFPTPVWPVKNSLFQRSVRRNTRKVTNSTKRLKKTSNPLQTAVPPLEFQVDFGACLCGVLKKPIKKALSPKNRWSHEKAAVNAHLPLKVAYTVKNAPSQQPRPPFPAPCPYWPIPSTINRARNSKKQHVFIEKWSNYHHFHRKWRFLLKSTKHRDQNRHIFICFLLKIIEKHTFSRLSSS